MTSAVPNISGKLSYRLVTPDDLPLLRRLREECGWGRSRLEKYWGSDDRPLCVFTLENEGEVEDIGMGGWILDNEEDPGATSRASGAVGLTSLFIRKQYQGGGIGTRAMDILERVAVERFGAKTITLDTAAYYYELSEDGSKYIADVTRPSRSATWYTLRGYQPFRDNRPRYSAPGVTDDNPEERLVAVFLRKRAEDITKIV